MVKATLSHILRVGLTGGIGSGKSTVSKLFRDLDVPVIDADEIAHSIVEPGQPGHAAIKDKFGQEIMTNSGELDRKKMRELIFSNAGKKQLLESTLHPLVYQKIHDVSMNIDSPYCLIVIPLLLETGGEKFVDRILVVDCDEKDQLSRVMTRDKTVKSDVARIMNSQINRQERLSRADDIILNDGEFIHLEKQVADLHKLYLDLAKSQVL